MKKLDNKGYAITIIIFGILVVFIIVLGSLLITMNNSVKLNKTVKNDVVENIELSADSTGLTLTDRIAALETKLADVEGSVIDTIYPVGSIYISTVDADIDAVKNRFPNTEWVAYAEGRTLVGVGSTTDASGNALQYNKEDITGGSSLITLKVSQLPSHSHTYSRSSSVTDSTTLTVNQIPKHRHSGITWGSNDGNISLNSGTATTTGLVLSYTSSGTDCKTCIKTGYVGGGAGHTHDITLTSVSTGTTGSGGVVTVQDPYITVYMYKRTK